MLRQPSKQHENILEYYGIIMFHYSEVNTGRVRKETPTMGGIEERKGWQRYAKGKGDMKRASQIKVSR